VMSVDRLNGGYVVGASVTQMHWSSSKKKGGAALADRPVMMR